MQQINPQQTVPTLNDNGFILWDSHAICIYLIDKYAVNHRIYPENLHLRATINQRIFFNAYLLFPATKQIFYPILFENNANGLTQEHQKITTNAYEMLNRFFMNDNLYLFGNSMTVADLIAVVTIDHLTLVQSTDEYPKITAWFKRMSDLPYWNELNGRHSVEFKRIVIDAIEKNKNESQ